MIFSGLNKDTRRMFYAGISTRLARNDSLPDILASFEQINTLNNKRAKTTVLSDDMAQLLGPLGRWLSGKANPKFESAIKAITVKVASGETLANALAGFMPKRELVLLEAGESVGALGTTCAKLADKIKQENALLSTIIAGLSYPLILLIVMFFGLRSLASSLLPTLTSALNGQELPPVAKFTFGGGQFLLDYGILMAVVTLVILVTIVILLPWYKGRGRTIFDSIAPFSYYRISYASMVLDALEVLIAAGVPPLRAVEQLAQKAQPWLAHRLDAISILMRQGHGDLPRCCHDAGHGFPDSGITQQLLFRGSTKNLAVDIADVAPIWLSDITRSIERSTKVISGLVMIVFAASSILILLSMQTLGTMLTKIN